ncbi:MAG: AI-2E family transporter, partial [Gemmatimonadales bacterium]
MTNGNHAPLALKLTAAVLVAAALTLGREFFIPLALATCFHALLRPVVRALEGWHLPAWLGATIVVLGTFAVIIGAMWALSGPVGNFINRAPASIAKAREKMRSMGRGFQKVSDAATGNDAGANATGKPPTPTPTPAASPPVPP